MLAAFLLSAAVMVAWRPFIRMERGDPAIYDYIAQSILRGEVPYRDVWIVVARVYGKDVWMFALSGAGLVMFAVERARVRLKLLESLSSVDLFRDAVLIPPLVYLVFCLVDMQRGPDLIPFLPFAGIFGGWCVVSLARLVRRVWPKALTLHLEAGLPLSAFALVLLIILFRAATFRLNDWSLQLQDEILSQFTSKVGPNDKIYVHGPAEILLKLNRPNLNPYISLDSGADDYIASKRSGGFTAVVAEMEAQAPKYVALERFKSVVHRDQLEQWVAGHYEMLPISGYSIYVRKKD